MITKKPPRCAGVLFSASVLATRFFGNRLSKCLLKSILAGTHRHITTWTHKILYNDRRRLIEHELDTGRTYVYTLKIFFSKRGAKIAEVIQALHKRLITYGSCWIKWRVNKREP